MKKKIIEEEKIPTIKADIPKIEDGKSVKITNLNGNYVMSELDSYSDNNIINFVEEATFNADKVKHLYDKILENDTSSFVTTSEEISNLAKNTQSSVDKVIKINGIIKYYINKEDLIGRVVEIIENNVNTNYSMNYSYKAKNKKEEKVLKEYKEFIDKFNKQIEIKQLIINSVLKTYTEGNYIFYLRGDSNNGYGIANYPLDMIDITNMIIDNENVISFKVNELSSRINKTKSKYGKLKTNKLIDIQELLDNEIKNNYPPEIYDAYKGKDQLALLNPKKVGLTRINNLGTGLYGVSPIFKSLSSLLTLETIDKSDREILNARSKKIYYQKTRKELMGQNLDRLKPVNEIGYAQTNLLQCMANNTIVYTSMPFVENLQILEPKTELVDSKTKEGYTMSVLTALGISFVSSEGSSSITTVKMVYTELLKMVNRISKLLEPILHKFYQVVSEENGYPIEFAPTINIQNTDLLDLESRLKLVETLYSKIGLSYDTILTELGYDPTTEINKRKEENKVKVDGINMTMDDIMSPHITSFTASGKEGDTITHNNGDKLNENPNGSKESENTDKKEDNQQYRETQV